MLQLPRQFSFLQRTVGTILSTLVTDCNGLKIWPNLLLDLLKISGERPTAVFASIEKICEDAAFELIDFPETFKPFLETILTLLQHTNVNAKNETLKPLLLSIICYLIPTQVSLLTENVTFLLNCLLVPSECVQLQISTCRLLSTLIEFYWTFLSPENIKTIFNYVFTCTNQSEDRDLLKQCGEFWLFQVQSDSAVEQFQAAPEILFKLIPLLVSRCVYDEEDDEEELCAAMEDLSVPDDEEDLKPRHRKEKKPTDETDFDDEDEIDESFDVVNSLRKCSAATLDGLSLAVDPKLFLQIFIPSFNTLVSSTEWKQREGALLALGAVAEGLWKHLTDAGHLNQIVPFLLANSRIHPHPLVRSMSLWTLSRISSWLTSDIEVGTYNSTKDLLEESLKILIVSLGDANKRVQQSATTALCKFLESSNAASFFHNNHRKSLLSAIFLALKCYQRRSLLILFDLIRIFGQIDENLLEFDEESFLYWRQIVSDLIERLNPQSIADSSIFPVIEALMSILLLDFNGKLLNTEKRDELEFKALSLAAQNLTVLNETKAEGFADSIVSEGLDDFLIAALDLLAAATESSKLTPSPHLQPLLKNILVASLSFKESTTVRQSAFALFGDYAALNNQNLLIEMESSYFDALKLNLYPTTLSDVRTPLLIVSMATATNAIWSLGELSLHTIVPTDILSHLIAILKDTPVLETGARIYYENIAVCIGRILIKTSANIVEFSGAFLNRILNLLTTVESELERSTAFVGYLKSSKLYLNERDYQLLLSKLNDLIDFQNNLLPDLSQILIGFNHPQVDSSFYFKLQPLLRHLLTLKQ